MLRAHSSGDWPRPSAIVLATATPAREGVDVALAVGVLRLHRFGQNEAGPDGDHPGIGVPGLAFARAVRPPRRSSPPHHRRTAGRPPSGSASARSRPSRSRSLRSSNPREISLAPGPEPTDRKVPVDAHAPLRWPRPTSLRERDALRFAPTYGPPTRREFPRSLTRGRHEPAGTNACRSSSASRESASSPLAMGRSARSARQN